MTSTASASVASSGSSMVSSVGDCTSAPRERRRSTLPPSTESARDTVRVGIPSPLAVMRSVAGCDAALSEALAVSTSESARVSPAPSRVTLASAGVSRRAVTGPVVSSVRCTLCTSSVRAATVSGTVSASPLRSRAGSCASRTTGVPGGTASVETERAPSAAKVCATTRKRRGSSGAVSPSSSESSTSGRGPTPAPRDAPCGSNARASSVTRGEGTSPSAPGSSPAATASR